MTGEIKRANKRDGSGKVRIHKLHEGATDLLVYHSKKKQSNQCTVSNGGCAHLCLALPGETNAFTCACPTHYKLVNKTECVRTFLLTNK